VHNSIPEYASTTNILKPFENKFLKKWFSAQISSKPLKRRKKRKKEEEKEKLQESLQIKGKLIFWKEKNFDFKNSFRCDSIFSPSIIPFQKPIPKSLRKFS
jgi:hypothetical protein